MSSAHALNAIDIVVEHDTKPNVLDMDYETLSGILSTHGYPSYRARQILHAIHREYCSDFSSMTTLSKAMRQQLSQQFSFDVPTIHSHHLSDDGTHKWILKLQGGNYIETVFIPEPKRGTLCISSQVGCILDCSFCSTGKQGFNRNLAVSEIIGQLWIANQQLAPYYPERKNIITNVVMMGMGEPLLNERHVITALKLMLDDYTYGLSKYRVTISTAGILPAMKRLYNQVPVALAVSLHATNDTLRNELVPINRKYPLQDLLAVCQTYFSATPKRAVVFEYVMLDKVNDTIAHANELIQKLRNIHCKINLIPFNPFTHCAYQSSPMEQILLFQDKLIRAGIRTTIRKTRGQDITAACGQLVGQVLDRTKRTKPNILPKNKTALSDQADGTPTI